MIMMALNSLWNFVFGWAGIDMLVGFAAVAVAVLEPKFMDAITDLRKWAIVVAVCAFTFTGLLAHGYSNGLAVKQAQWDAALVKETGNGETARSDAERTVGPVPASRELLRGDPFNRNLGKPPVR